MPTMGRVFIPVCIVFLSDAARTILSRRQVIFVRHAARNETAMTRKVNDTAISRRSAIKLGGLTLAGGGAVLALSKCQKASDTSTGNEQPTVVNDQKAPEQKPAEKDPRTQKIEALLASLSLEQKVAQLFFVRPESIFPAEPVTAAGEASRTAYTSYPVGGIVYFAKNLTGTAQTKAMLANVRQFGVDTIGAAPFISVDEEGGTVKRIAGNSGFGIDDVGDMSVIGNTEDPQNAREAATTIASYLKDLGFNMDFAPDADIANNPKSNTMRRRSFGSTADAVAPMVAAAVEGFLSKGLGCTAKHFPGIGGAEGDSETELIYTEKTVNQMTEEELVPFQAAIKAGVPFVMVGHLACPSINGDNTPASLSKTIVTDVLRGQLDFGGIAITDSLGMGAVVDDYPAKSIGVTALQAGIDMILMPADFEATYQGVLSAVQDGTLSEKRIEDSLRRILAAKYDLGLLE